MQRSRKVAVVAHCLLNSNARVDGIARYPGIHPIVSELAARGYGLIQLACPELRAGGLSRPPAAVEDYDTEDFRRHCASIVADLCAELNEYRRNGYEIGPVIGMESSPSCAVAFTTSRRPDGMCRVERPGVLMGMLIEELRDYGVAFAGIDHHEADNGVGRILEMLTKENGRWTARPDESGSQ